MDPCIDLLRLDEFKIDLHTRYLKSITLSNLILVASSQSPNAVSYWNNRDVDLKLDATSKVL